MGRKTEDTPEIAASSLKELDAATSLKVAEVFKVLGDMTRIKLLALLSSADMRVSDIAGALGMGQSAISHQLRVLRGARLVKFRKEGKEAWYSLDDDHVVKLMCQALDHVSHG
ncbi:MAG: winged helix-turn-helix transcriptional regulator [Schwartzia sp.]|nr:winged helix-turn-helix transcriptional regulator [Schwartzia sp. (in: firmicutes)]